MRKAAIVRVSLAALLLLGGSAFGGPAMAGEPGPTGVNDTPTAGEIARHDALLTVPTGARNPKLEVAGGEASVTIEWDRGKPGPFITRVYGSVKDTGADNVCAHVDMWYDGKVRSVTPDDACPKGDTKAVKGKERAFRVLVRLCAEKCTGWV
jgi:hypothetical protein